MWPASAQQIAHAVRIYLRLAFTGIAGGGGGDGGGANRSMFRLNNTRVSRCEPVLSVLD